MLFLTNYEIMQIEMNGLLLFRVYENVFFTIPKCDIRSVFECFNTIKEIKIEKVCEKHKIRTSHKHKKTDVHLQDRCSLRIEKNEQTIARYIFQKLNQIAY